MASQKSLWSLMAFFFVTFICSSHANTFEVGGKDGWTLYPSESYDKWSGRMRFLINDTLHFKYDGRFDSVLEVNKADYDRCYSDKPFTKLDYGDSFYKFHRSGPFYFISGNKSNCDRGQKFVVLVLALRNYRSPPPSTATPPTPATAPPGLPPSPSTAVTPSSPTPGSPGPAPAPVPAPAPDEGEDESPPGGGGSASKPADVTPPPPATQPSSSPPPLSGGTVTASFVTMIFALWWIN